MYNIIVFDLYLIVDEKVKAESVDCFDDYSDDEAFIL